LQHKFVELVLLRRNILCAAVALMLVGLFFSRAVLSIAMIFFVAASIISVNPRKTIKEFIAQPLLWAISLLFFIPFISGLWSDTGQWQGIMLIKLPLLLMPLAFAADPGFTTRYWNWLGMLFILLVLGGSALSIIQYASDFNEVNEQYLQAKTLITPLNNDHVRFSWMVNIAIIACCYLYAQYRKFKTNSWLILLVAVCLVIFLHILAARTGLLSFYGGLLLFICIEGRKRLKLQWIMTGSLFILLLPVAAYFILPSFRNRIQYFNYERHFFKRADYIPGSNDGMRLISIRGGGSLMLHHPIAGVGFGNMKPMMNQWYDQHYPLMHETDKILPSSEWILYGAGTGVPGFLLFIVILVIPFTIQTKNRNWWLLINLGVIIGLMTDIGLEVQFGVFLFSFVWLWWWKWLNAENRPTLQGS
jgi:O-antigen ligase